MIVKPNSVDRSGLNLNIKNIQEFPPLHTNEISYWGHKWVGDYKKSENLINSENINEFPKFKKFFEKNQENFDYGFITYLDLITNK